MNINLKYILGIYTMFLSFECACSAADLKFNHNYPIDQCYEARQGTLNVELIDYSDPLNNSYLLDCAVSVSISEPSSISGKSKSKTQRRAEKEKNIKIADFLLSKEIDINFKNEYGDTLLLSVILSFLPDEWKEKTVKILIKSGVNIMEKNNYGDTAMVLAKYKGNAKIIKILSVHLDKM